MQEDPSVNSMFLFTVGHNMPGYLPEADPWSCETWEQAKLVLIDDMEHDLDGLAEMNSGPDHAGDFVGRMGELEEAITDLKEATGPEYGAIVGDTSYWIACEEVTPEQYAEVMEAQR